MGGGAEVMSNIWKWLLVAVAGLMILYVLAGAAIPAVP